MRIQPYAQQGGQWGSLTRDRGCLYYVPWICILMLLAMGAGIGVWVNYTIVAYNSTNSGLTTLQASSLNADKLKPAMIGTAVAFLVLLVFVAALSFVRSFIEAAHDATGATGAGSTVYLWLNAIMGSLWYLVTLWLVLVLMADAIWACCLYVLRGAIQEKQQAWVTYGATSWDKKAACPGACFDLTYFNFLSFTSMDSCTCDQAVLQSAYSQFDDAYTKMLPLFIGAFLMFVSASLLGMNLACQFSHTKRERECISRVSHKQFAGVM